MSLRFRKSVNIGGFRINLSKSGVGYSFCAMGVRYTKKANGGNRITSSIKGTGISYVKDFSKNNKTAKALQQHVYEDDIEETSLVQSSSNELVEKLNEASKKNNRNKIINICLGIVAFYLFYYMVSVNAWCAIPLIGVLVAIGILCKKQYVVLNYDFSNNLKQKEAYNNLINGIDSLMENDGLWEITSTSFTTDYKSSSGASQILDRAGDIKVIDNIKEISSNLYLQCLKIQDKKILFLPDMILIYENKEWVSVEYNETTISYRNSSFIEEGEVPEDTNILGYRWKYVNKNGSPDKRYNDNRELPICAYGEITITLKNGLNLIIIGSNRTNMETFYNALNQYIKN